MTARAERTSDAGAPSGLGVKTIVYIDHAPKLGGASRFLVTLVQELSTSAVKPVVVCPAGSDLEALLARQNTAVVTTPMPWFTKRSGPITWCRYLFSIIQFTRFLDKIIRDRHPMLIHTNSFVAALYAVLPSLLFKIPSVWHVHEIVEPGIVNRVFILLAAWRAQRILCVSSAVQDRLILFGVPRTKCSILYNFVSFPSDTGPARGALADYGVPENAQVVGMIGNICELKGQIYFVKAIREISSAHPNAIFVIVGDVSSDVHERYKQQVIDEIKASGLDRKIIMTGFRQDAQRILRGLDILVHPATRPDSLPTVLLEAMYHAKPVIASRIGGIPEIVLDGLTGLLIPPSDSHALAQSMSRLLDSPEIGRQFGASGRRLLERKFNRENFLGRIQAVYAEAVASVQIRR